MNTGSILSVFILSCLSCIMIIIYNLDARMQVKQIKILLWMFFFGVLAFSFYFEPSTNFRWDLLEHYKQVDYFRGGDLFSLWAGGGYAKLPLVNLLFYVSSLFDGYWVIQVVPFFIDGVILLWILFSQVKKQFHELQSIKVNIVLLTFFYWFSTVDYKLALTGIRCVLSVAICSLALYFEFEEKIRKRYVYLLLALGLSIHHFACAVLFIRFLAWINRPKYIIICLIAISMFGQFIIENFLVNIPYFGFIFDMIDYFSGSRYDLITYFQEQGVSSIVIYIFKIILCVYLLYITVVLKDKCENLSSQENKMIMYVQYVSIFAICMFFNYLFQERSMYIVAYAFAMIGPIYFYKIKTSAFENGFFLVVASCVLFMTDIYPLMVNYVGYWFLGRN